MPNSLGRKICSFYISDDGQINENFQQAENFSEKKKNIIYMAVATENYKFSIPNLCDYRTLRVFRKPLFIPISYFDTCKLKPSKVRFS